MFDAKYEKQPAISGTQRNGEAQSTTWIGQAVVDSESTCGFLYYFNGKCV